MNNDDCLGISLQRFILKNEDQFLISYHTLNHNDNCHHQQYLLTKEEFIQFEESINELIKSIEHRKHGIKK